MNLTRRLLVLPVRLLAALRPSRVAAGLAGAIRSIRRNMPLAATLARRELTTRHAGQFLGMLWVVGQPLFLMMVFVFIFGVVFVQRIGDSLELPRDYTIYILSGLVPWMSFMPGLITTSWSVVGNGALVKQVSIDPEMFPLKDVLVTFVFWVVGVSVIALYTLSKYHEVPWTYLLLPAALLIQFSIALGLGWLLSSLTVFVRDLREFVQMLSVVGVYILPVVFLPQWVPGFFRPLLYFNPFSYMIWVYQDVFYFGRLEHPHAWLVSGGFAILCLTLGHRVFRRLRPYFSTYL